MPLRTSVASLILCHFCHKLGPSFSFPAKQTKKTTTTTKKPFKYNTLIICKKKKRLYYYWIRILKIKKNIMLKNVVKILAQLKMTNRSYDKLFYNYFVFMHLYSYELGRCGFNVAFLV